MNQASTSNIMKPSPAFRFKVWAWEWPADEGNYKTLKKQLLNFTRFCLSYILTFLIRNRWSTWCGVPSPSLWNSADETTRLPPPCGTDACMLHTGRHSCHGDGFLFQWQPQRLFGQISQWIGGNCCRLKFLAVHIIHVRLANLSETDGLQSPSKDAKGFLSLG